VTQLVTTDVVDGTSIDSSDVNNNMAAVRAVVNGNLDDSNLAAAAAIAIAKLANFPSDATRFLRGDGNWAVPPVGGGGPVPPASIVGYPSDPSKFLRGDGAWAAVSVIPSSIGGFPSNGSYALRGDGSWGTAYTAPAFIAGYPSDSTKFLRGDGQWAAPSGGAAGTVAYGTSLPASPADGQEAILVDSTTNATYAWRFRYNAAASSPYKWEFVGGSPANPGNQFTCPRAGLYSCVFGTETGNGGTTSPAEFAVSLRANTAVERQFRYTAVGAGGDTGSGARQKMTGVAADGIVSIINAGNVIDVVGGENSWVQVFPVRVA